MEDLTEQQVRTRALELANDWATARAEHVGDHPGTRAITKAADAFAAFINEGTVVDE